MAEPIEQWWSEEDAARQREHQQRSANGADGSHEICRDDFQAYMPMHAYIYTPTGELWPASSVNARLGLVDAGIGKPMPASTWLDQDKLVEQMTWAPGSPMLIRNRLVSNGGWIERRGATCFNLYRPPCSITGDPTK